MNAGLQVELLHKLSSPGLPRYRQIADQLTKLIVDVAPGTRLPSEHDLVSHLGVSRATAVQALRELEVRGLVNRRQGRGSFVTDTSRAIRSGGVGLVPSFSRDLQEAGHSTSERVLVCERRLAPDDVAIGLEVTDEHEVWCVRRVILSDGDPVIHVTSWLPAQVYPEVVQADLEGGSLYSHLEKRYGTRGRPTSVEEEWGAAGADRDVARALDMRSGAPAMCARRRAFLADGTPAEYAVSWIRAETFVVSVRIAQDDLPNVPTARIKTATL